MNAGGTKRNETRQGAHLIVVGAGGNIGSHLVPLLGRMAEIGHLTLIDPDVYEEKNLQSQDIFLDDVGKPKVQVQAMRLQNLAPDLPVTALTASVEDVPWGELRGDLILTGLDTRRARQAVNRRARWLGMPWLDAGVEAGSGLARVSSYGSEADQPCLECAWTDADYQLLEQRYSCDGSPLATPASGAPARLGALAAAWQAIECHRLLATHDDDLHLGRQWVIAPEGAEVFQSQLTIHPGCRLPEHEPWQIEMLTQGPDEVPLGEAFTLAGPEFENDPTLRLEVPDQTFLTRFECTHCERQGTSFQLGTHPRREPTVCTACGQDVQFNGLGREDHLLMADLTGRYLDRPLARLGFRPGEVFRLSGENLERTFQLPLVTGHSEGADHEA